MASSSFITTLPTTLYGVTIDNISNLKDIIPALQQLPVKPIARIVFDEGMGPNFYKTAVTKIHADAAYVMGELADSSTISKYSIATYQKRAEDYLTMLNPYVDIWEIGNEINGEWLGKPTDVSKKMIAAYNVVKAKQAKAALTLYYNEGCYEKSQNEMFQWVSDNVPQNIKDGIDYLFVSYYEDDCAGPPPDWQQVFTKLHAIFKNAYLGFGEVGTKYTEKKQSFIERYYSLHVTVPNFVGGYFWWYFCQDMVPKDNNVLWSVLASTIKDNLAG